MTATVSDQLTRETRIREAWEMVERAEPGDSLSVGVALDYVMDAVGCERGGAKSLLYRYAASTLHDRGEIQEDNGSDQRVHPATIVTQVLFSDNVEWAKKYLGAYCAGRKTKWAKRAKRAVKLCSWIEAC
jgi:hypothetical protein